MLIFLVTHLMMIQNKEICPENIEGHTALEDAQTEQECPAKVSLELASSGGCQGKEEHTSSNRTML